MAHPDSYREYSEVDNGSVAQLYSASDFGSEGWGLESLRGHKKGENLTFHLFIFLYLKRKTIRLYNYTVARHSHLFTRLLPLQIHCFQCINHQRRYCHWTNTTRNRRNIRAFWCYLLKFNISR